MIFSVYSSRLTAVNSKASSLTLSIELFLDTFKVIYMTSEGSKVILRFVSGRVLNSEQARADYCVPLEYFFVPSFWPEFS